MRKTPKSTSLPCLPEETSDKHSGDFIHNYELRITNYELFSQLFSQVQLLLVVDNPSTTIEGV